MQMTELTAADPEAEFAARARTCLHARPRTDFLSDLTARLNRL
jgi:hypothetical protein